MLVKVKREKEYDERKFLAALKGIELDDDKEDKFEEIKRRAEADLAGKTPEQLTFEDIGIDIEQD